MPIKVLLVDDEEAVRKPFQKILAQYDFDVAVANNGLEAIALAGTNRPDVIVMDLKMPKMGGVEAIKVIKSDPATDTIPIIVLSAYATPENVRAIRWAGVGDFILKEGFNLKKFIAQLGMVAHKSKEYKEPKITLDQFLPSESKATQAPNVRETARGTSSVTPKTPVGKTKVAKVTKPGRAVHKKTEGRRSGIGREAVLKKLDKVFELKALPFVAAEIIHVTSSPDSNAQQLTGTIERDQALTAKVLRFANSAFYSTHGRVQNLTQAVSRIGFREIRQISLAVKMIDEYRGRGEKGGLDRMLFWKHSLACGVLARELATTSGADSDRVEEAFLAGLLHDVGKAILDDYFHKEYARVLRAASERAARLQLVELEELGIDHTEVSKRVLVRWSLPEDLIDAIALHHTPWEEVRSKTKGDLALVAIVWIANVLAIAARIGWGGDGTLVDIPNDLAALLGLDREKVLAVVRDLDKQMEDLTQVLLLHGEGGAEPERAETSGEDAPPGPEVLIVHEVLPIVDPLEVCLGRFNCLLRAQESLAEAWENGPPNVVLVRANSDRWLGWFAGEVEKLKRKKTSPFPRFVILSDGVLPKDLRDCLGGGDAVVLRKPFSIRKIEEAVGGAPSGGRKASG